MKSWIRRFIVFISGVIVDEKLIDSERGQVVINSDNSERKQNNFLNYYKTLFAFS